MSEQLRVEPRKVSELRPYDRNSRAHTPEQIAQVARSIQEFGWTNPILIDRCDMVIAGHARLEAAKSLGMEDVPVIQLDHLSEEQARAYVIADNRIAELAGWDDELLRSELAGLQDLGVSLELLGFDITALRSLDAGNPADSADSVPLPDGDRYQSQYGVIVVCVSESEQAETYERLREQGYECRVVTT